MSLFNKPSLVFAAVVLKMKYLLNKKNKKTVDIDFSIKYFKSLPENSTAASSLKV